MKKKLLIAGGVVAGLIVIGLLVVYLSLNAIVRSTVESSATQSLKVRTTLAGASVSPFGGSAALSGLQIGSPEGFTAPQMFSLGAVSVDSSLGNLFGDPVRVVTIKLDRPQLVIEQANGKFNFLVLRDNIASDKPAPREPADPNAKPMKLVIDQLDVTEPLVSIRPGIPGLKEQYDLKLPGLSLKNIGNADGTQTGEELGRVVTDLVSVLAAKAAESDQLPPEVRQVLQLDVNKLVDDVTAKVEDRVRSTTQKVGDQVEKEAAKQLDKLLGGKKKDDQRK